MAVQAVIGASILYYLQLGWWWWVALGIALLIDIFTAGTQEINSAKTVSLLSSIDSKNKNS